MGDIMIGWYIFLCTHSLPSSLALNHWTNENQIIYSYYHKVNGPCYILKQENSDQRQLGPRKLDHLSDNNFLMYKYDSKTTRTIFLMTTQITCYFDNFHFLMYMYILRVTLAELVPLLISSPDSKGHMRHCHHLGSVIFSGVVVHNFLHFNLLL